MINITHREDCVGLHRRHIHDQWFPQTIAYFFRYLKRTAFVATGIVSHTWLQYETY